MSDNSAEHLSCLIDDELDTRGSRFFIRRLASDRGLQATWRRYYLIRSCLHGEAVSGVDISRDVAERLIAEEPINIRRYGPAGWLKPVAGGAIAAAVAVLAVTGLVWQQGDLAPVAEDIAIADSGFTSQPSVLDHQFSEPAVPVGYAGSRPTTAQTSQPDRVRINTYVLRHNQAAGGAGSTGFIPYVPIVTESPERFLSQRAAEAHTINDSQHSDHPSDE